MALYWTASYTTTTKLINSTPPLTKTGELHKNVVYCVAEAYFTGVTNKAVTQYEEKFRCGY